MANPPVGQILSFQASQSEMPPTPSFSKAGKLPKRGAYLQYSIMGKLQDILIDLKKVTETSVEGLGLVREDLGVRRNPKPHRRLPEAK